MIIDSFDKFEAAEKALMESKGDIKAAINVLRKYQGPLFESANTDDLAAELSLINEGLKDSIINFISSKIGGDISKLKTALTQMKEQELKFNKEEFTIFKDFYGLIKKQKALEKDSTNPKRDEMLKAITDSRRMLNNTLKELVKTHDTIFNSLEEKVKSLTKDSNRKKKYFNVQRASDVLETQIDRYNKSKELSKMYKEDVDQLEKFFGVDFDKISKDVDKSRELAKKAEEDAQREAANIHPISDDMLSVFTKKFQQIKTSGGKIEDAVKKLDSLHKQVVEEISGGEYSPDMVEKFLDLNEENQKVVKFLLKAKDGGKIKMTEVKVS